MQTVKFPRDSKPNPYKIAIEILTPEDRKLLATLRSYGRIGVAREVVRRRPGIIDLAPQAAVIQGRYKSLSVEARIKYAAELLVVALAINSRK